MSLVCMGNKELLEILLEEHSGPTCARDFSDFGQLTRRAILRKTCEECCCYDLHSKLSVPGLEVDGGIFKWQQQKFAPSKVCNFQLIHLPGCINLRIIYLRKPLFDSIHPSAKCYWPEKENNFMLKAHSASEIITLVNNELFQGLEHAVPQRANVALGCITSATAGGQQFLTAPSPGTSVHAQGRNGERGSLNYAFRMRIRLIPCKFLT